MTHITYRRAGSKISAMTALSAGHDDPFGCSKHSRPAESPCPLKWTMCGLSSRSLRMSSSGREEKAYFRENEYSDRFASSCSIVESSFIRHSRAASVGSDATNSTLKCFEVSTHFLW